VIRHALGIVAAIAVIVLCTLRPFLPGRYDALAVPLSQMSVAFGIVGLLLVPFGAAWAASIHWSRFASKRALCARGAAIALAVVWGILSLVALASSGWSLAVLTLAAGAFALWMLRPVRQRTAPALYMIVVPIAVAVLQLALVGRATDFSRNRAIQNSAPLLADIERFRANQGRYPPAIASLHKDYSPGVVGIERYEYTPAGDAFHLHFEQLTFRLGTQEIVMYNPRDEHAIVSHDSDALRRPQLLSMRTGFYAMNDAPQAHWKYFWFD
jgi:hypothetical protein